MWEIIHWSNKSTLFMSVSDKGCILLEFFVCFLIQVITIPSICYRCGFWIINFAHIHLPFCTPFFTSQPLWSLNSPRVNTKSTICLHVISQQSPFSPNPNPTSYNFLVNSREVIYSNTTPPTLPHPLLQLYLYPPLLILRHLFHLPVIIFDVLLILNLCSSEGRKVHRP